MGKSFRFSIDRGGTFTDIYCEVTNDDNTTSSSVHKLLSEDPSNYDDAPTEGIRRILEYELKIQLPRRAPIPTAQIHSIRMGTTVATNALLERKGERVAFITTKGCGDLQYIGNQSRPKIFDLEIKKPDLLYEYVAEVNERVIYYDEVSSNYPAYASNKAHVVEGTSHEKLVIEKTIDEAEVIEELKNIKAMGITALAVCFMHSYIYPTHERKIEQIARQLGFTQVSLSSEVMPMIRVVPRGCTTCVDAYLTPVIKRYLDSFAKGFDQGLVKDGKVTFMQSDGGLTGMHAFSGNRAILSGPAGGVVGFALTSEKISKEYNLLFSGASASSINNSNPIINGESNAVIGFDMGGTSTDVSRYAGTYEHVFESTTAGVTIQSPQLDINTVAAGGGSRLFFRTGLFVVGPDSAGAHPGPVCYRKGGPLAVTDANVVLGRIQPHLFPAIFGPTESERLDYAATLKSFEELTERINSSTTGTIYTVDEVAAGFIRVANEAMARPIRNLTTMKGRDVTAHALATFGGAGPQHCCAIAKSLGIKKIYISRYSGVLSAYGLSLADVVVDRQDPMEGSPVGDVLSDALAKLAVVDQNARSNLKEQGFQDESISSTWYVNCRYQGTDTAMMVTLPQTAYQPSNNFMLATTEESRPAKKRRGPTATKTDNLSVKHTSDSLAIEVQKLFIDLYKQEYGFELPGRPVLVDDVRVRAVGKAIDSNSETQKNPNINNSEGFIRKSSTLVVKPSEYVSVYFDDCGRQQTPVYQLSDLSGGSTVPGPAIIIQDTTTVVLEPACEASITQSGDIVVHLTGRGSQRVDTQVDPIYLSIFSHRFMGIAEQMGRTLQRTSISVNIKERLDFSCALFDPLGGLVANAPHLPVHLGAMSEAVKYQRTYWGKDGIEEGDVLVSNHPQLAGGSHLPDITVITPVFIDHCIAFFVASRGHHADVGGIAPGSMPPLSKTLAEEGAAIVAFKLVQRGIFMEKGISELLMAPGNLLGNSGARKLADNLSDLRAQVAANQRGVALMTELVAEYSLPVVQAYMQHIQNCAEEAVRAMLREFSVRQGMNEVGTVMARDCLDDGTPICLSITIDRIAGSALFDFAGTGPEVLGNLNAPPAVTSSAVIYCLRCLLPDSDIPLNQGCLVPVTINIPAGSVLHPSDEAAVVGGNVLTCQRVTDVVLKAFRACAASQGCMNNLTFGNSSMGYYETIAGGAGAGPTWNGCSAVHTHMTNTRITDPEILEKRYPTILRQFAVRRHSGGEGKYKGGDGVTREIEFTQPLVVSILSERRSVAPFGLEGGGDGERGLNLLSRWLRGPPLANVGNGKAETARCERLVSIGGKNTVHVEPGDRLTIYTPGGGGYGVVEKALRANSSNVVTSSTAPAPTTVPLRLSGSLLDYSSAQESV